MKFTASLFILLARNYHLGDTEKALREVSYVDKCHSNSSLLKFAVIFYNQQALEWRRSNRVDEILKEYEEQEIFQKYFALDMVGKDKYGCPGKLTCY